MNLTNVRLLQASSNLATNDVVYTFALTFEKQTFFRRLFKLEPKILTRYCTGTSVWGLIAQLFDLNYTGKAVIMDTFMANIDLASAVFTAQQLSVKIPVATLRMLSVHFGSDLSKTFKVYQPGEYHIPSHNGVALSKQAALATGTGWEWDLC